MKPKPTPGALQATAFELVDPVSGEIRASLSMNNGTQDGEFRTPELKLYDHRGVLRITIGFYDDEDGAFPIVDICDENCCSYISIMERSLDGAPVMLLDENTYIDLRALALKQGGKNAMDEIHAMHRRERRQNARLWKSAEQASEVGQHSTPHRFHPDAAGQLQEELAQQQASIGQELPT